MIIMNQNRKKKKVVIAISLYNKRNIDNFLNYLLPLQFTNENLKIFKKLNYVVSYGLYLFKDDIKILYQSKIFQKLKDTFEVNLGFFDDFLLSKVNMYKKDTLRFLTLGHNLAINDAIKKKSILILLNDNFVIHETFFKDLFNIHKNGFSLISIPKISLEEKSFIKNLQVFFNDPKINKLSSKELIKIAIQSLFKSKYNIFFCLIDELDKTKISFICNHNDDYFLMKFFNYHPIFIDFENIDLKDVTPIEGYDLLDRAWLSLINMDKSKIKVIEDSNDLVLFELSQINLYKFMKSSMKTLYFLIHMLSTNKNISFDFISFKKYSYFLHTSNDLKIKKNLINKSFKISKKLSKYFYNPSLLTRIILLFIRFFQYSFDKAINKVFSKISKLILFTLNLVGIPKMFKIFFDFLVKIVKLKIINVSRLTAIGHFVVELEFYVKEHYPFSKKRTLILCPPRKMVCNSALLDYWKKYYTVITSTMCYILFYPLKFWNKITYHTWKYFHPGISNIYAINKKNNTKLFDLKDEHFCEGKKILSKMKIPENAWYVCFNARSSGCNKEEDDLVLYRNSNIDSLFLALQEIEKRGGWCIRIGNKYPKLSPRFSKLKRIVDYSNSEYNCDWMDIFFSATCKFFLGSSISGICHLPMLFHTPCVIVNILPFTALPYRKTDLFIFKNYYSILNKRLLTFFEVLFGPIHNSTLTSQYVNSNIIPLDNTEEEIKEVVIEMLNRMENKNNFDSSYEILQNDFKKLFCPNHLCYQFQSNVGFEFLKKYSYLFDKK